MKNGIVILSIGRRGYGFAAWNLAMSIRDKNQSIPIHLFHDGRATEQIDLNVFSSHSIMDTDDITTGGHLDPGKAKTMLLNSKYIRFDNTLYIDADSLCINDPEWIFDELEMSQKSFMAEWMGRGIFGDEITYDAWAAHVDSFEYFDLPCDTVLNTIQTSWFAFKNNDVIKEMADLLRYYTTKKPFPIEKLKHQWGGTVPDELLFMGVCAKMGIEFDCPEKVMYFPNDYTDSLIVENQFSFLTLYGPWRNRTLVRPHWFEYYDRYMINLLRNYGLNHNFKHHYIMPDKHLDSK